MRSVLLASVVAAASARVFVLNSVTFLLDNGKGLTMEEKDEWVETSKCDGMDKEGAATVCEGGPDDFTCSGLDDYEILSYEWESYSTECEYNDLANDWVSVACSSGEASYTYYPTGCADAGSDAVVEDPRCMATTGVQGWADDEVMFYSGLSYPEYCIDSEDFTSTMNKALRWDGKDDYTSDIMFIHDEKMKDKAVVLSVCVDRQVCTPVDKSNGPTGLAEYPNNVYSMLSCNGTWMDYHLYDDDKCEDEDRILPYLDDADIARNPSMRLQRFTKSASKTGDSKVASDIYIYTASGCSSAALVVPAIAAVMAPILAFL